MPCAVNSKLSVHWNEATSFLALQSRAPPRARAQPFRVEECLLSAVSGRTLRQPRQTTRRALSTGAAAGAAAGAASETAAEHEGG